MDYFDLPGISASMLKSMAQGWRQYEFEYVTKTAVRKETPAMAMGTAIHMALLEPDKFATKYAVCPQHCTDGRTKAYKEWAAEMLARGHLESQLLSPSEKKTIDSVLEACANNRTISQLLAADGTSECVVCWKDEETALECKAKVDRLNSSMVLDVKTTDDAREAAFAKTIHQFRYDLQAAHYLNGTAVESFVFIAVEKAPPFRARLYELTAEALKNAAADRKALLREYSERSSLSSRTAWCEPGENAIVKLSMPYWSRLDK